MRYIKERFIKSTAALLAVIMVIGVLPPVITVYANVQQSSISFENIVTTGVGIAPVRTGLQADRQAMVSWDVQSMPGNVYTLRFPVLPDEIVEFRFQVLPGGETAQVDYRIFSGGSEVVYDDILIYAGSAAFGYRPPSVFHTVPSPDHHMMGQNAVRTNNPAHGSPTNPSFIIERNSGFSFVVNRGPVRTVNNGLPHDINFLWDGDTVHFVTTGVVDNIIHPFRLEGPGSNVANLQVLTGLDFLGSYARALHHIPTNRITEVPISPGHMRPPTHLRDSINILHENDPDYAPPATDPNSLLLRFAMPDVWDWNGQTNFTTSLSPADPVDIRRFYLYFTLDQAANMAPFAITYDPDALGPGIGGLVSITGEPVSVTSWPNEDYFEIEIGQLPPSTIFGNTTMAVIAATHTAGEPRAFAFGGGRPIRLHDDHYPIYTFLDYNIIYDDGFFVNFTPFNSSRSEPGVYTIYASTLLADLGNVAIASVRVTEAMIASGQQISLPLNIPLSLETINNIQRHIQIIFTPDRGGTPAPDIFRMFSQVTLLEVDESWVNIGRPRDFTVPNELVSIRPSYTDPYNLGHLQFTAYWTVASLDTVEFLFESHVGTPPDLNRLDSIRLYFDLNSRSFPHDSTAYPNPERQLIEGLPVVITRQWEATPTPGRWVYSAEIDFAGIGNYDFLGFLPHPATRVEIRGDRTIRTVLGIDYGPVYRRDAGAPITNQFEFPNVYWLNADLVSQTYNYLVGGVLNSRTPNLPLRSSNEDYLTLSAPSRLHFPPPLSLRIPPPSVTDARFDLVFDIPSQRIEEFSDTVFGVDWRAGVEREVLYNVFISEDEDSLVEFLEWLNTIDREHDPDWMNRAGPGYELLDNLRVVDFAAVGAPVSVGAEINASLAYSDMLDYLRERYIVLIKNWPVHETVAGTIPDNFPLPTTRTLQFTGLDINQSYYTAMDARGFFRRVPPSVTPSERNEWDFFSITTGIVGIITRGDLIEPDPGDVIPQAPIVTHDRETATQTSAEIRWNIIAPPLINRGTIDYEIIRVQGQPIPDELLGNRDLRFTEFWYEVNRIMPTESNPMWLHTVGVDLHAMGIGLVNPTDTRFDFRHTAGYTHAILEDHTLSPNVLYFYYVRAVWRYGEDGGVERRTHSTWRGVSVTTMPVRQPANLQIHRNPASVPSVNFNTVDFTREMVITFEAPITDIGRFGIDYDFQLSLMRDTNPWGATVNMSVTAMRQLQPRPSTTRDGYYIFTYVIRGLNPGTQYSVRVRMRDLTRTPNDFSAWSNIAVSRTDTDQAEYDRDRDVNDLYDYLRNILREAMRNPHFTAQNTGNSYVAIYRPSMTTEFLATGTTNMVRLADTGHDRSVHYIPQAILIDARDNNRGMLIGRHDMEIFLPHNAISLDLNPSIIEASRRIRDIREIQDYYLRITSVVRAFPANALIDGRPPVGQEVLFSIELVETLQTARNWDNHITQLMMSRIESGHYTGHVNRSIQDLLNANASFEFMTFYLRQMADDILLRMEADIQASFAQKRGRTVPVAQFTVPVNISYTNAGNTSVVNGLQWATNTWARRNTITEGNARTLQTNTNGTFAFSSQNMILTGITALPNSQSLTEIIVRHGLDDFIGRDEVFNINANASVFMTTGVAARLAGATSGTDHTAWLRGRGYIVPTRAQSAAVTNQEMVYLMMAMYEIRTNTRIDSMRITNFARTANMQGIDQRFLRSIQAALELGFIRDDFVPTGTPTVGDLLRMVEAMNRRVRL